MRQSKKTFRHESLQNGKTIQGILDSLSKGMGKGKLSFSDEDGEIVMEPEGLLNLKVTASEYEGRRRINIRITWHTEEKVPKKKALKVEAREK
ncbi:MAG: amphi-Trp domain-containing protein [Aestuariibacter sp.]|nr:amphi-Trp domain-containing protein [Aestuariibacter sp.]